MQRVTFGIGQGFDASGKPLIDLEAKRKEAFAHVAECFGGFTATLGQGGWIDGRGALVMEPSLTITTYVSADALERVESCARYLQTLFAQESVLIARESAQVRFTEALAVAA